jgi:hypothetical protein
MSRGISKTDTSLIFATNPLGMACRSAVIVLVEIFVGEVCVLWLRLHYLGCISSVALSHFLLQCG